MLLRIRDWDSHFENNRTRELKYLDWIPMPVKMDGDGYTELLDHRDGASHFGAWCALVEVAARCDPRGTLMREGDRPHDFISLSRVTRISAEVFTAAIPRLIIIGWIEVLPHKKGEIFEISHDIAPIPHPPAEKRLRNGTERKENGTEDEHAAHASAAIANATRAAAGGNADSVLLSFPCVAGRKKGATSWEFRKSFHDELAEAFPDVDLIFECKKAIAWLKADTKRRKTFDGMRKFLTGWMNRAQNDPRSRKSITQHNGEIVSDDDPTSEEGTEIYRRLGLMGEETNAA